MWYKVVRWLAKRLDSKNKVELAEVMLKDVQESEDYSIKSAKAEVILETVIKSNGNKITDFILRD